MKFQSPRGSNTVDGGLRNSNLASITVPILQQSLAGLGACCTFLPGQDQSSNGKSFVVPIVTTSNAALTNPSNLQQGDATLVAGSLAAAHVVRAGHVAMAEKNLGLTTGHIVPTLAANYASDLIGLAMAQVTAANFGASLGTVTTANFDEATVELLVEGVAGQPRAILTASKAIHGIRANLFRENGKWITPNVEGGVWEMNLAAASNNASAVIATPEALVGVIALPAGVKLQQGDDLTVEPLTVEGLGTIGYIVAWLDKATRASWVSVESVVGFCPGQSTALRFVASS